jgi:hypothetical protein
MRAVWSFWTTPFRSHHKHVWLTERHHLLAWVLSVETAKRHYADTALYTDEEGARLLVDGLGLEFAHVSTELTALECAHPEWWVMGKLWTYRAQRQPFVHIDSDVFLWQRLPVCLERSGVFAQNPETFAFGDEAWYRPVRYDEAIRRLGGWAPCEWRAGVAQRLNNAVCCGIVGGQAVDFLAYYADLAIRMIRCGENQGIWAHVGSPISDNILIEQYLLAACVEYHRGRARSPFRNIDLEYLFQSAEEAFDEAAAARVGYTHLIGGAKGNPALLDRLERRVRREHPHLYDRCVRVAAGDVTTSASAR